MKFEAKKEMKNLSRSTSIVCKNMDIYTIYKKIFLFGVDWTGLLSSLEILLNPMFNKEKNLSTTW